MLACKSHGLQGFCLPLPRQHPALQSSTGATYPNWSALNATSIALFVKTFGFHGVGELLSPLLPLPPLPSLPPLLPVRSLPLLPLPLLLPPPSLPLPLLHCTAPKVWDAAASAALSCCRQRSSFGCSWCHCCTDVDFEGTTTCTRAATGRMACTSDALYTQAVKVGWLA